MTIKASKVTIRAVPTVPCPYRTVPVPYRARTVPCPYRTASVPHQNWCGTVRFALRTVPYKFTTFIYTPSQFWCDTAIFTAPKLVRFVPHAKRTVPHQFRDRGKKRYGHGTVRTDTVKNSDALLYLNYHKK